MVSQNIETIYLIALQTMSNVKCIKCLLRCFELAFGLKINFHKSRLAMVGVVGDFEDQATSFLNYRSMEIPFVYFGIPIRLNPKKEATWEPILSRMRSKLSTWKHKILSFSKANPMILWTQGQILNKALSILFLLQYSDIFNHM